MIRTMLRTGGTVAISMGALLTAGSMNLAVLNGGPEGPGNLVIRAAPPTTTTLPAARGHAARPAPTDSTTSTAAPRLTRTSAAAPTTTAGATTTSVPARHPTSTTTRPPGTTTTTHPPSSPQNLRVFTVRDAGHVRVRWVNKRTISATAVARSGFSLPHVTKQGPDITLRFQSKTELVVWHGWVEAHQIKAWIKTYRLSR